MPSADQAVRTYRELAENYGHQGQAQMRDRYLVLAADAALTAGQEEEAERLRGRLLQHNPHHLLKPYSSFAEAMKSVDVQNYISALRRNHPYEKAEHLLEGMHQNAEGASPLSPSAGEGSPRGDTPPLSTASAEREPSPRKEAPEDLKVFRVRDPGKESKAAPPRPGPYVKPSTPSTSPPPARPVLSAHSSQPPPGRPASAPEILPIRREPYPAASKLRATQPEKEDRDLGPGAWVSMGLFFLTLVMGILLAIYSLIRPFFPQGWF
jgi:hypothetical protein